MKRYVKTVGFGLVIGLVIVGLYELAGGDATVVVVLVMLAALVKVRFDELQDILETMREAEPSERCGDTINGVLSSHIYECRLAAGHRSSWHSDERHPHPMHWQHHP